MKWEVEIFVAGKRSRTDTQIRQQAKTNLKLKKMRKVIFSLAFMLIGSFAFANTNAVVTPKAATTEVVKSKINSFAELEEALKDFEFMKEFDNYVSIYLMKIIIKEKELTSFKYYLIFLRILL